MTTQEATLTLADIVQHHPEMISSPLGDEIIVLNIETVVYHGLNEIAGEIWNLLAEPTPIRQIVETLLSLYDIDRETCERETLDLLTNMLTNGIIISQSTTDNN